MTEVIIEGLEYEDFIILEKIIKDYKISINSDIKFDDILKLHDKVQQIINHIT